MGSKVAAILRNGKKQRSTCQQLALNHARCKRFEPTTESAIQFAHSMHLQESKCFKELVTERDTLAARNSRLKAKRRNALKSLRLAKKKSTTLSHDARNLKKQLRSLTVEMKKEKTARESDEKRYKNKLERYKQLKIDWKRRAYAAEESRRYMLAKKSKIGQMQPVFKTKLHGAYSIRIRSLSRKLIMSGVSAIQVPKVIRICAQTFGVKIGHIPSPRSVGRFVLEGGVGAAIQTGNILANAQGITTSMDSTSQRNINFSSMHIMANTQDTHQQLYLAVKSTTDHTSETQVAVLRDSIEAICDTTKRAPKCLASPDVTLVASDVARKLCGANGDHAKDQLKVAELERQWKVSSWVEHLGNLAHLNLGDAEAERVYQEIQRSSEATAGGADIFATLSLDDQEACRAVEYQRYITRLGSAELNKNTSDTQFDNSQLIRGGCCAHKDMNAVKGGASGMLTFWKENKMLTPPIILFNKDNDATVSLSKDSANISPAEQRAIAVSEAGAIKLCSLAGAVFNHKDDKKGLQDMHTYWFEARHRRFRRFPDTSNVRYSSYVDAATELCVLHGAYIDFMEHCRQKKGTGVLNHMENNVLKGLNCPATLGELLVISLYGQIISKPYLRLVRTATVAGKGLADLAELHAQVQRHIDSIISCPGLVLSPDATAATATLDGSEWDCPEVFDALRRHESTLPFLENLLVAFCRGVSQTWTRFTEEFAADAPLALLSLEQRNLAFMPPTNDANEGALGTWRVWTRRYPRLTLHKYNALMANRSNGTEAYMEANFTPEQHAWTMAETRRIDSSKLEETRKTELVIATEKDAEKNRVVQEKRIDRRNQRQQYVAGIKLELDQTVIAKMKGAELNDQLKVYRQILANHQGFPSTSKRKVEEKRLLVAEMAAKYVQAQSILQMSS